MTWKKGLQIFGGLTVVLTLFRYIALDYWWIRVFDFPHVQLTIISAAALLAYFIKFDIRWAKDYLFVSIMAICLALQIHKIYPYTCLGPYEMQNATQGEQYDKLKILTANVLQKNDKHEKLQELIRNADADLMLFTETNNRWMQEIQEVVGTQYPYKVEVPLNNTYGMLLYSKLELIDPQVRYLVDDSIPSIRSKLRLKDGALVQLYTIHPTPPMPQHNPKSSDRDKEMMITAKLAMDSKIPVIVLGDFNDVAWSQTTSLFQNVSGLLDPRKGRGLYNTFNAKNILMRWPLDHIFVSEHFRLIDLQVEEDIASDHFPISAVFSFEPEKAKEQRQDPPTEAELKNMREQMKGSNIMNMDVD